MSNVSLKKDFKNGDKLYDYQLNNNFATIEAALAAMNRIVWQDDEENGASVSAYKGNTEEIEARDLIDGQLLYNTETGETYIDTYVDDVLTRINTGSGNVVAIQDTEPTNDAVKLWIEEDILDVTGSEIESGSNSNGNWIKFNDGTLIQWNSEIVTDQAINNNYGGISILYTGTRNIGTPIDFKDANYVVTCAQFRWGASASWGGVFQIIDKSNFQLFGCDVLSRETGTDCYISWTAIGRWK